MSALRASHAEPGPTTAGFELRLYRGSEPGGTIETRRINQGSITLGRDPRSDWVVSDPDRTLSRKHCELIIRPGGLVIRVSGVNGAYVQGEKVPAGVEVLLHTPCVLVLGDFRLAVDRTEAVASAPKPSEELVDALAASLVPRTLPAPEVVTNNRSLLEAFCDGAGLDSSLLAGEEPDEVMRRAGAIYRNTVLGVSDLMLDRDRARSIYDLQRTKIAGAGNNLFKWASSQRLIGDLLLTAPAGFLSGPDAVQSSFKAIRRHFAASQTAMRSCFRALIDIFSPDQINREVQSSYPHAENNDAVKFMEVCRRHAEAATQLYEENPPFLEETFALAYEGADSALERSSS